MSITHITKTSAAAVLIALASGAYAQESGPDELSFAHIPAGSPLPPLARSIAQIEPAKVFVANTRIDAKGKRYHDKNPLGVGPANDSR